MEPKLNDENDGREERKGRLPIFKQKKSERREREGDVISLNLYVCVHILQKTMMTNEQFTIWDLSKVLHH